MAIGFARLEFVKRSSGKTACGKAAYNSRSRIEIEEKGASVSKVFDWSFKEKSAYHDVLIPKGVNEKFKSETLLWNAIDHKEKRCNSQLAIDLVLALPDDNIITLEDRIYLSRSFVQKEFIDKGLAAQIDIHAPEKIIRITRDHEEAGLFSGMTGTLIEEKESQFILQLDSGKKIVFNPKEFTGFIEKHHNWHTHVLASTRRFTENGLDLGEKARDLMPRVCKGKVVSGSDWGKLWTEHQNRYFQEKGLSLRVDSNGIIPQEHLGPVRMRGRAFALIDEHHRRLELNRFESKDPLKILDKITENLSVFKREDVERFLDKYVSVESIAEVRNAFWQQKELVQLVNKQTGELLEKFSSKKVIEEEKKILRLSDRIHSKNAVKINPSHAVYFSRNLRQEQLDAFNKVIQGKRLTCIHGYAGTGKSYLLAAIRDAYQDRGYRVRAFGPDNASSNVLTEKGFQQSENIYRFLFGLKKGSRKIDDGKEVWILDEAGKLGNRPFLEFLKEAEKRDVQVVLSGDYFQLPSVERGGMFKILCERYGSHALKEVLRQRNENQREMAKNLATGEFGSALDKLCVTNGIIWSDTKKQTMEELIIKWAIDTRTSPQSSTIVIAHTNDEVRILNEMVRMIRKQRGELGDKEFACETAQGKIYISVGDRIEFRKNEQEIGVTNGLSGTLIEAKNDQFVVSIKEGKNNRIVKFNPQEYHSYQLGYASTYYRCQGKTVDRAYVLQSRYMNRELFYVGLTRHIEKVDLFVSKDEIRCLSDLKRQAEMSGGKESTLVFTTREELLLQKTFEQKKINIQKLKQSNKLTEKIKGFGLSAWDAFTTKTREGYERFQDRSSNKEFFNPVIAESKDSKVNVTEVSHNVKIENNETKIMEKILSNEKSFANERNLFKSGQRNFDGEFTSEPFGKTTEMKKDLWSTLANKKQESIREYFECCEKALTLRYVVEAEAESASKELAETSHFKQWQGLCGKRNASAHRLLQQVSSNQLKSLFTEKSIGILYELSARHEALIKKTNLNHFVDIEEKLKDKIEPLLFKLFPEGATNKTRTSFRFGNKGSLSVEYAGKKAGSFYDFENQQGGGLLKLIQKELGLGRKEAKGWAEDFLQIAQEVNVPRSFSNPLISLEKKSEWISLIPNQDLIAPKLEEISSKKLHLYFNEITRHEYRDENGQLLHYVLRLQSKSNPEEKAIFPLSYGYWKSDSRKPTWELKGFECETRTLYNLQALREKPSATVLIVEGEKTADHALEKLPKEDFVSISWLGGASSVNKSDWAPLSGRKVLIWPDNDKPGFQAAHQICKELRKIGVRSLDMIDPAQLQKHFPEKWDLADSLPTGIDKGFLKKLLLSPLSKGINPEQLMARVSSLDKKDPISVMRANEMLWRVEERLRPELEKKYGSHFLKTNEEILRETAKILVGETNKKNDLIEKSGLKGDALKRFSYQINLYQAKYGYEPVQVEMDKIKAAILECSSINISRKDHRYVDFAIDKLITRLLERPVLNNREPPRLNELQREVVFIRETIDKHVERQESLHVETTIPKNLQKTKE